jgi:hypothetical protein
MLSRPDSIPMLPYPPQQGYPQYPPHMYQKYMMPPQMPYHPMGMYPPPMTPYNPPYLPPTTPTPMGKVHAEFMVTPKAPTSSIVNVTTNPKTPQIIYRNLFHTMHCKLNDNDNWEGSRVYISDNVGYSGNAFHVIAGIY